MMCSAYGDFFFFFFFFFFSVSGRLRHVNLMRIKLEHRQDRKGQAGAVLNRRQ